MGYFSALTRPFYNNYLLYIFKIFLALSGAVIVPFLLTQGSMSIPAILGVVAAGLTDLDDHIRGRIKNIGLILGIFFIASLSVELLLPYPLLFFIALVSGTICLIMLGVLGQRYATLAFGTLIITIYAMLSYIPDRAWYIQPLLLVLGALWYNLISLFFNLIWPIRPLQESLSSCFSQLGRFLEVKSQFFDPDEMEDLEKQKIKLTQRSLALATSLDQTRIAIMRRLKNDRGKKSTTQILRYYLVAQEIYERAASAHVDYEELHEKFLYSDVLFRFQRLLMQQSVACQQVADELLHETQYQHTSYFNRLFTRLENTLKRLAESQKKETNLIYSMGSLLKNLKGVDTLLAKLANNQDDTVDEKSLSSFTPQEKGRLHRLKEVYEKIKLNLTPESEVFRHAVRMTFVMAVSYLTVWIINAVFSYFQGETVILTRAFWIMLTAIFVCQPNYSATKSRVTKRLWGTLLGVISTIGVLQLGISTMSQIVLVIVCGTFFFSFRRARYSFATALITIMILLCFNLKQAGFVAPERMIDTIVGCAIAWFAVVYILPDWNYRQLSQKMNRVSQTNSHYLQMIQRQYHEGRNETLDYILARDNANNADGELSALFSSLSVEPKTSAEELNRVFNALCLNNNFLGYISALGSHRSQILDQGTLSVLDKTVDFIVESLETRQLDRNRYEKIKSLIRKEKEYLAVHDQPVEEILTQQLILLLKSLPPYLDLFNTESLEKSSI